MANKFNVFVYEIGESWAYIYHQCEGEYSILADFEDVNGNITSCRIVGVNIVCGRDDLLCIDDYDTESFKAFAERLLKADEFSIEIRCKDLYWIDGLNMAKFAQILRCMTKVSCSRSGVSVKNNLRDALRYVQMRHAPHKYWDDLRRDSRPVYQA